MPAGASFFLSTTETQEVWPQATEVQGRAQYLPDTGAGQPDLVSGNLAHSREWNWIVVSATKHCGLGWPLRPPELPGDSKESRKHAHSCQQLSEILKSSFSRIINIFHNHPKGGLPPH